MCRFAAFDPFVNLRKLVRFDRLDFATRRTFRFVAE
jgi:hypothetical protein